MPSFQSSHTGAEHDQYVTKADLINLIYPVGAIYMSVNSANPSLLFGGTWEQIEDRFLLAAGSTYTAGDIGGKTEYEADDMPAHTHTRGTMEITGRIGHNNSYSGTFTSGGHEGAFYNVPFSGTNYYLSGRSVGSGWYDVAFEASRSWEGETSQSGLEEIATIIPPYLTVYIWKRVA